MYSIRRRLLVALSIVLTLTTFCCSLAIFVSVKAEVNKLLDASLKEVGTSFKNYPTLTKFTLTREGLHEDQGLVVQVFDPLTRTHMSTRKMKAFPIMERVGLSTVLIDGQEWRLYTAQNVFNQIIEVGQPINIRSEIAFQVAKPVLLPLFFMMLLVGFVLWLIILRGFSSITEASTAIAQRSPALLAPLSFKGMPQEIAPLIASFNELLTRLSESFEAQKRFASDAAHELRTPLTALTLQLQLAERATTEEKRNAAFKKLKEGIQRASRLVQQLLVMARLDPDNQSKPMLPFNLALLVQNVGEELELLAQKKQLKLKSCGPQQCIVIANEEALRLLLTNLCDNAIRYTPAGGEVELTFGYNGDKAYLSVSDDGPGISIAERERIFERFYRAEGTKTIPGTGIGLAIVRRVAEMHQGELTVSEGIGGKGVRFTLSIPARPHKPNPI